MIFCPCWVTSQTGPTFSVTSMRPSGRNARRQGRLKVVTGVMLKGRLASDFCSPALTWAQTAAAASVSSNAAFANFIVISPSSFKRPILREPGALSTLANVRFIKRYHEVQTLFCFNKNVVLLAAILTVLGRVTGSTPFL